MSSSHSHNGHGAEQRQSMTLEQQNLNKYSSKPLSGKLAARRLERHASRTEDILNESTELERIKLELDGAFLFDNEFETEFKTQKEVAGLSDRALEFNQVDGLRVKINDFVCDDPNFRQKMEKGKLLLECKVPDSSDSHDKLLFADYKFFSRDCEGRSWIFNNVINQNITLQEGELRKLLNTNLTFKLLLISQETVKKGKSDHVEEIASGELSLEKVIVSPNYLGNFNVKMKSRVSVDHYKENIKGEVATKQKRNSLTGAGPHKTKAAAANARPTMLVDIGDLKIFCMFTSTRPKEIQQTLIVHHPQNQAVFEEPRAAEHLDIPLQILLDIQNVSKTISKAGAKAQQRNIFISHKVYGTSQMVKTDVVDATGGTHIGHRIVFPISGEHLRRMSHVPMVLEVWEKGEGRKDELLGLVKLNLEAIPTSLLDQQTGELNYDAIKANQNPIMVYDDSLAVVDIKTGQENGQLQLVLAAGTPSQVPLF